MPIYFHYVVTLKVIFETKSQRSAAECQCFLFLFLALSSIWPFNNCLEHLYEKKWQPKYPNWQLKINNKITKWGTVTQSLQKSIFSKVWDRTIQVRHIGSVAQTIWIYLWNQDRSFRRTWLSSFPPTQFKTNIKLHAPPPPFFHLFTIIKHIHDKVDKIPKSDMQEERATDNRPTKKQKQKAERTTVNVSTSQSNNPTFWEMFRWIPYSYICTKYGG